MVNTRFREDLLLGSRDKNRYTDHVIMWTVHITFKEKSDVKTIPMFKDMGHTCLVCRGSRPDVQSALNSGPVDQHSHVLKTDHNYASWLQLIEVDNKQVVLFQGPRGSRRQTQIKIPRCFLYRFRVLWFYGVVMKLAGVQVPAWTRKEVVTTQFPSVKWHEYCRTTETVEDAANIKSSGWKRIWPRHW